MSLTRADPEQQTPDKRFKRLIRRWRNVWRKHHSHREHKGSRRK